MSLVETQEDGHIGTIILVHDAKKNALSHQLIEDILAALAGFEARQIRVVILRSRPGAGVWSAGHDVRELPHGGRDPLAWDDPLRMVIRAIEQFPAPIIAQVEGSVWGGACEVVMACDIVIAGPGATFAITPAKLGIPYNLSGILTFLNAACLGLVKEMVFTARPISAARAEQFGVVNHVVPVADLDRFTKDMANQIAANSPLSIRVIKEELRLLAAAHPLTPLVFERIQGLRRLVYDSHDYQEGIDAFLGKRAPKFTGS